LGKASSPRTSLIPRRVLCPRRDQRQVELLLTSQESPSKAAGCRAGGVRCRGGSPGHRIPADGRKAVTTAAPSRRRRARQGRCLPWSEWSDMARTAGSWLERTRVQANVLPTPVTTAAYSTGSSRSRRASFRRPPEVQTLTCIVLLPIHASRRDGHPETTEPAADRLLARGHAGSRPRLCGRPGPEPRDEVADGLKSDLLIDPALPFRHPEAPSPKRPGVRVVYGWVHHFWFERRSRKRFPTQNSPGAGARPDRYAMSSKTGWRAAAPWGSSRMSRAPNEAIRILPTRRRRT